MTFQNPDLVFTLELKHLGEWISDVNMGADYETDEFGNASVTGWYVQQNGHMHPEWANLAPAKENATFKLSHFTIHESTLLAALRKYSDVLTPVKAITPFQEHSTQHGQTSHMSQYAQRG